MNSPALRHLLCTILLLVAPLEALAGGPFVGPVFGATAGKSSGEDTLSPNEVGIILTARGVGATLLKTVSPAQAWQGDLFFATSDSVLEARVGRAFVLTQPDHRFRSTLELSVTGLATTAGPFDIGIGPHAGAHLGLAHPRIQVLLGITAGIEAFLTSGGPRFPLRLEVGTGLTLGSIRLLLLARAGADVEGETSPVFRQELGLELLCRPPAIPHPQRRRS